MAGRSRGVRLDTGNFKQSRAMCGPACLKIVLAYFGKRASEKLIAKACRASRLSGTSGANLVTGAKRFGFRAEVMDHSDLRTIEKCLRRGVPVIVDWMSTVAARGTSTAAGTTPSCAASTSATSSSRIPVSDDAVAFRAETF